MNPQKNGAKTCLNIIGLEEKTDAEELFSKLKKNPKKAVKTNFFYKLESFRG
jgi:hypothetical protein